MHEQAGLPPVGRNPEWQDLGCGYSGGLSFCIFLQILVQIRVTFGDIWVRGGCLEDSWRSLGVPEGTWGVQCRFLSDVVSYVGVAFGSTLASDF